MSRPQDPYPVTLADIERQTADAHPGTRGHVTAARTAERNGKPILKKAQESEPMLIQHT